MREGRGRLLMKRYIYLLYIFLCSCILCKSLFFIHEKCCTREAEICFVSYVSTFYCRHTFDDIFMPICLRRSINRTNRISPSRELIHCCVSTEPGIIYHCTNRSYTTSSIRIVSSGSTVCISDISYIAICREIFTKSTFCKPYTENKSRVYTFRYAFFYPERTVLEIVTCICFEEFFLSFWF